MQVTSTKPDKKIKIKIPGAVAFEFMNTLIHLSLIKGDYVPIKPIKPNGIITISNCNCKFGI
jgi:hypothetical protein